MAEKAKNLRLFYIHELLFQFSDSMLIIVLPVFIYKLFDSVAAIFIFTLAWNLIYAIFFLPVFNWAMGSKKPKITMALGMLFYITALGLFGQMDQSNLYLIVPATIIFGLYITFYWMIRHWIFSLNVDPKIIGSQISKLLIIRILITFLAPIIGGVVSFFVSFNVTFILGALAGLFSTIPIALFKVMPHKEQYDWKKVRRILRQPELKAIRPAYFYEGLMNHFINNAWVLAFAIFIGTIMDLGILVGVTTLITALLVRLVGVWFDKRKRTVILSRMTWLRSIAAFGYALVFVFPHVFFVWVVELANRFIGMMHSTVVDSYLFAYSSKIHPVHFHFNREVHLTIARLISSALLAILFYLLPEVYLWLVIAIGAFMAFGWMTLKRSDHLLD